MPYLPVYVRVGTAETWLGDLDLPDFERSTVEQALPGFLISAGRERGSVALEHGED